RFCRCVARAHIGSEEFDSVLSAKARDSETSVRSRLFKKRGGGAKFDIRSGKERYIGHLGSGKPPLNLSCVSFVDSIKLQIIFIEVIPNVLPKVRSATGVRTSPLLFALRFSTERGNRVACLQRRTGRDAGACFGRQTLSKSTKH